MIKQISKKIDNNKEKVFGVVAIVLIIFFAISLSPKSLQNDTFYTVTIGKLILENKIDMQDHFSWHQLPYTYPHWLYDVGMYLIYNVGEWQGVYISTCVLASILGICIYFVNSRLSKNKLLSFILTIAVLYLIKNYIAARAQLVTFIFFILQVYNIERFIETKKIINAITLLVIHTLIANLHVAVWPFTFVLYMPYIGEYLIAEFSDIVLFKKIRIMLIKRKLKSFNKKLNDVKNNEKIQTKIEKLNTELKSIQEKNERIKEYKEQKKPYKIIIKKNANVKWLIVIMIIAIFTGLLTPLGKVPFTYTYDTITGNTMDNINEHLPLTLINNTPMIVTIIVVIALLTFTDSKILLADLFMIGGLCYMMFSSRRQQSMFILIGSIGFTRMLTNLIKMHSDYSIEEINKRLINKFTIFVLSAIVIIISFNMYSKVKDDAYIKTITYPVEASEWILENLNINNIRLYNEYNYGSYLLYKGIPVFIDSRADLYTPEFNTPTGNKEDGKDIFGDFMNTSAIKSYYGDIIKKYDITHVILYKNSKMSMLIQKADSEKYKEIYSDDNFVIYEVVAKGDVDFWQHK